jgi:hypothetical protein
MKEPRFGGAVEASSWCALEESWCAALEDGVVLTCCLTDAFPVLRGDLAAPTFVVLWLRTNSKDNSEDKNGCCGSRGAVCVVMKIFFWCPGTLSQMKIFFMSWSVRDKEKVLRALRCSWFTFQFFQLSCPLHLLIWCRCSCIDIKNTIFYYFLYRLFKTIDTKIEDYFYVSSIKQLTQKIVFLVSVAQDN